MPLVHTPTVDYFPKGRLKYTSLNCVFVRAESLLVHRKLREEMKDFSQCWIVPNQLSQIVSQTEALIMIINKRCKIN